MEGFIFQSFASPSAVSRHSFPCSTCASGFVLKIVPKCTPKEVPKGALGRPSGVLGASRGILGLSWGLLGCLGASPACKNTCESVSWASPTRENTSSFLFYVVLRWCRGTFAPHAYNAEGGRRPMSRRRSIGQKPRNQPALLSRWRELSRPVHSAEKEAVHLRLWVPVDGDNSNRGLAV